MLRTLLDYFEQTVDRYHNKVALIDEHTTLSFDEFRSQARCIAQAIRKRGIRRNQPIMVYLPKSVKCVVSFMGILYSGNFYTPTDVRFPFEKVRSIIDKLSPALYLTDTKHASVLLANNIQKSHIICIDTISDVSVQLSADPQCEDNKIIDMDIAYTFFTSGSTGIPKGVMISHANIVNHMQWYIETFDINEETVIGNQGNLYFDLSTPDVYGCVMAGATLVIIPQHLFLFPGKLLSFLVANKINFTYWVASVYTSIASFDLLSRIPLPSLKKMLSNGEVMPSKTINYWKEKLPNLEIIANLYGPTEATVACSYYKLNRCLKNEEAVPIGCACSNMELLVFDENMSLITQPNKRGELYVRGSSVSPGYWNDPVRTQEVFIANPLNPHCFDKFYKTGDIVYYNEYKELMFVGRKDFQIKLQGYRIELGEIETALISIADVDSGCCVYDEINKKIVCFFTGIAEPNEVNNMLKNKLPDYMVPKQYRKVPDLPRTPNGKIDRLKLINQIIKDDEL